MIERSLYYTVEPAIIFFSSGFFRPALLNSMKQLSFSLPDAMFSMYSFVTKTTTSYGRTESSTPSTISCSTPPCTRSPSNRFSSPFAINASNTQLTRSWLGRPSSSLRHVCVRKPWNVDPFGVGIRPAIMATTNIAACDHAKEGGKEVRRNGGRREGSRPAF